MGGRAAFEDRGNVLRRMRLAQFPEHVIEDVHGLGGKAGRGAHRRRGTAGAGVVGPENEPERIDQEKLFASQAYTSFWSNATAAWMSRARSALSCTSLS